jgi:hypothetical protein
MILNLQNLVQLMDEILLNETDKNLVDFELDLYWVVRSEMIHYNYSKHQDVSQWHQKIWIKQIRLELKENVKRLISNPCRS